VVNLLKDKRKLIENQLREEVSQRTGQKVSGLENPDLDWDALHFTLCAPGTGRGPTAGEVLLSHTATFPKAVAKDGGTVYFDLLPEAVAGLEAARGKPLRLLDLRLRVEGSQRVQFERVQWEANFSGVQKALTQLQNRLTSVASSAGGTPEAWLYLPLGGDAGQQHSIASIFSQEVVGSINVRADAQLDLAVLRSLSERLLDKVSHPLDLAQIEEKQRVAILLGSDLTISDTLGEIRTLARQERKEREAKLKLALDDLDATRNNASRNSKGSLGVFGVYGLLGGGVGVGG
jgi:hypothetical protein